MEFYKITEQQVFNKALDLYSKALKLDPDNFQLAQDIAQTYYGIRPPRYEDALKSWTNALHAAETDIEKEGVYIHVARIKASTGHFDEARQCLNSVTNEFYNTLKKRVARAVDEKEAKAKDGDSKDTNAPTNLDADVPLDKITIEAKVV